MYDEKSLLLCPCNGIESFISLYYTYLLQRVFSVLNRDTQSNHMSKTVFLSQLISAAKYHSLCQMLPPVFWLTRTRATTKRQLPGTLGHLQPTLQHTSQASLQGNTLLLPCSRNTLMHTHASLIAILRHPLLWASFN